MPQTLGRQPTLRSKQKTYKGTERVLKEKCRSIDGHQWVRHKGLDREPSHRGMRSEKCCGRPPSSHRNRTEILEDS